MKIDVIITLDQELTDQERRKLHFQHDLDLPDPDGVIAVVPAAPEGWLGKLPSQLGINLDPLLGAEYGLLIAQTSKDLLEAETVLLQGLHQETGYAFTSGMARIEQLSGNGRWITRFRILRDNLAALPELESVERMP